MENHVKSCFNTLFLNACNWFHLDYIIEPPIKDTEKIYRDAYGSYPWVAWLEMSRSPKGVLSTCCYSWKQCKHVKLITVDNTTQISNYQDTRHDNRSNLMKSELNLIMVHALRHISTSRMPWQKWKGPRQSPHKWRENSGPLWLKWKGPIQWKGPVRWKN